MKGFIKGVCSVACVLFFIGVGATVVGFATGGHFINIPLGDTGFSIISSLEDGLEFGLFSNTNNENNHNNENSTSSSNVVNSKGTTGNAFEPTQKITALDFEIAAANMQIVYGEAFKFENEGKYRYSSRVSGTTWKIEIVGKQNLLDGTENVTITIPEGSVFTNVDFEFGAGNFEANDITTDVLDIELGAGNFKGEGFVVNKKTDISCGAANFEISGTFNGKNDVECGAGAVIMNFDQIATDIGYRVELGLGRIKLFDQSFSGIADKQNNKGATSFFELECGVGSIEIN